MGSDSVLAMHQYASAVWAQNFMRGIKIPPHFATHTNGSTMAIPVQSFIVALCKKDDVSVLHDYVDDRPIIAVLENIETKELSSSEIKWCLQAKQSCDTTLSGPILNIINKHDMYEICKASKNIEQK